MSYRVTIVCDNCSEEYTIDEEMDLPPYWLAIPINISNGEGIVNHESFAHFCSLQCMAEYSSGEIMKENLMLIDKMKPDEDDEDDEDDDRRLGNGR